MRSQVLDQESFAAPSLNTKSNRTQTETGTHYSTPHHKPHHVERDSLINASSVSVLPASKVAKGSKNPDLKPQILLDNANARQFLRHNSLNNDAKLNSPFLLFSNPTSTSFGDFLSKHRSLLSEVSLENSQSVSTFTSIPRKGRDPPACRSLSPTRVEFTHTSSQRAPITPKHCFKEPVMDHQSREQSNISLQTASPISSTEKGSLVVSVLQQLLELVDRYWNGSGSLLLSKDFLAPAQDLLAYLMATAPSQQDVYSTSNTTLGPNSAGISYRLPREQLKHSQHFNSVDKPVKLEEGQRPPLKELGVEAAAATSSCGCRGIYSLSYDELLSRNDQLNAQVDLLTFELKQEQEKEQDTISLLRESLSSLVSTNNFLLQQLNKEHDPSIGQGALLSEKITDSPASSFEGTSHHSAPLYTTLGCSAELFSSCPL
ncbi:leucine-rich repeat-containing protein 36 [Rhineura floridana]|uniref:leucine-rich repeat-containing protein 36 n=1 Tax=Rhineura floridana TaxID=261503 RepID=UPI002AC88A54|nr:leucine-rich repeat-containing protein 36 [Rhineura floridana]